MISALTVTIAERARYARRKRGLTQRQLASRMKERSGEKAMSQAWLALLETGRVPSPGYESIMVLANALDVPAPWLVDGEGAEPQWEEPASSSPSGAGA